MLFRANFPFCFSLECFASAMFKVIFSERFFVFQGDLGAIDDKYDVAISTACGPLDNIVCDTIETAQNCVNFLKRNNIGTATFIALDKVYK